MRSRFAFPLLAAALAPFAGAQTFNWTGAADGNWANAANWSGGAPVGGAGTAIVIDLAAPLTLTNNFAGGFTLNSLRFGPSAGAHVLDGNALIFDGVAPTLVSESTASADVIIRAPIVLNQTLSITGGPSFDAQLLFGTGGFSGGGGITWTGGIGAFNAASTYTGATQILGGVLTSSSSTGFGATSGVTVASGAALQLQSGANLNRALSLSGAGFGSLATLHAANGNGTWSGAVTLAGNASFGAINANTLTVSGAVGLGANTLTLTPNADCQVTVTGAITGTGGVLKTGAGLAALSNNTSNYTGATQVSSGILRITGTRPLGNSSLVTVNPGAELQVAGAIGNRPLSLAGTLSAVSTSSSGWSGAITLVGNATMSASFNAAFATLAVSGPTALNGFKLSAAPDPASAANVVSLSGAITGAGSLDIVTGSGSVNLTGNAANTFTGPVTVQGNLTVGAGDSFGNLANSVAFGSGSVLRFSNSANIGARPWTIAGPAGLVVVPSNFSHTIAANISGAGALDVTSIGTGTGGSVSLTGTNTFTGGLRVGTSATVRAGNDAAFGAAGGAIALNGGSLFFNSGFTLPNARAVSTNLGFGGLSAPAGVTATVAADISGAGGLQISGGSGGAIGGTVVLSGNNTYAGGTSVNGATLALDRDARLGAATGALNFAGQNRLLATGDFTIAATRSTTFTNLVVDTDGHNVTFAQALSGSGLTKDGLGVLRFDSANANSATGNFMFVNAGTLQAGVANALGAGATVALASDTRFELLGNNQTLLGVNGAGEIALGGATLVQRAGFGGSFGGVISGAGSLVFENGSFLLTGANTFTGATMVRLGGNLFVGDAQGLGAAGNTLLLDNGGLGTISGPAPLVVDATSALTIGAGGARFSASGRSLVLDLQLSGSNPLQFTGGDSGSEVRLANAANTFVGDVKVSRGGDGAVLGIVADGSLGAAANTLTLGSKFFDGESTRSGRGTLRAFADLTVAATRNVTLDGQPGASGAGGAIDTREFTVHIAGPIGATAAGLGLQKQGGGSLRLDGHNTYTGPTEVLEGELGGTGSVAGAVQLGAGTRLAPGNGAGIFTIGGDLTLAFDSTVAFELGGLGRGSGGYDGIDVGGTLFADGTLQVSLLGGFSPLGAETFQLFNASSIAGTFVNFDLPVLLEGLTWDTSLVATNGTLSVTGVVIPEPSTWALLIGLLALATAAGRRHWAPR